jgi:hypothetical protein
MGWTEGSTTPYAVVWVDWGWFLIPQSGFIKQQSVLRMTTGRQNHLICPIRISTKSVRPENPKSNQPSKHYQANEAPNVQRMFAPGTKSCDANPL